MKYQLQKFDQLCQSIITQKKHGFFHNLRPFARTTSYFEQDFQQLWEESLQAKVKSALEGAGLKFKYKLMNDSESKQQRDIYKGSTTPGILYKFEIDPGDEHDLIEKLLQRSRNDKMNDMFAAQRSYLKDHLLNDQAFTLHTQMHVIGRMKPKQKNNVQNQTIPQMQQFDYQGVDGNVYIWFDFSQYYQQMQNVYNELKAQQDQIGAQLVAGDALFMQQQEGGAVTDMQLAGETPYDDINELLQRPVAERDKVHVAKFSISIQDSLKTGLVGKVHQFINGTLVSDIGDKMIDSVQKIFGVSDKKSGKPDVIKRRGSVFGKARPYIQVWSSVTMDDWVYETEYNLEKDYMNAGGKLPNEITKLTKFPFQEFNLREEFNPIRYGTQVSTSPCWAAGNFVDATGWNAGDRIDKKYLQNWRSDDSAWLGKNKHFITLRFWSWVRKNNHRYYFDYRVAVNLADFCQTWIDIQTKSKNRQQAIYQLEMQRRYIEAKFAGDRDAMQRLDQWRLTRKQQLQRKKKVKLLQQQIKQLMFHVNDFKEWLNWFINYHKKTSKDSLGQHIAVSKYIYDNTGHIVNKDSIVHNSIHDLVVRDITAYKFIKKVLVDDLGKLTVQGQPFNDVMNEIGQQIKQQIIQQNNGADVFSGEFQQPQPQQQQQPQQPQQPSEQEPTIPPGAP